MNGFRIMGCSNERTGTIFSTGKVVGRSNDPPWPSPVPFWRKQIRLSLLPISPLPLRKAIVSASAIPTNAIKIIEIKLNLYRVRWGNISFTPFPHLLFMARLLSIKVHTFTMSTIERNTITEKTTQRQRIAQPLHTPTKNCNTAAGTWQD